MKLLVDDSHDWELIGPRFSMLFKCKLCGMTLREALLENITCEEARLRRALK
jgi:hypothetical protein